ncbi:tRNA (cytosine(34)-C(5))-methyltransferase isoform X2 [Ischnura elegans]|uniref:tRNA (cytosine(34)-C(5))-methyltransferase isoform X2 n=1 Tax=Ischnura elegans TaxID=197161 RepID=UPI001ED8B821|nr:tRNA (cytosine(34)-C(5))-methyltransferase isoform X2 [Ischnura elegans]
MGKSRKMRRKDFSFAQKRRDKTQGEVPDRPRVCYDDIVKENENFEKYYQVQRICPEGEWEDFMKTLRVSLPAAFRITGFKDQAKALLRIVQGEYFAKIANAEPAEEENDKILLNKRPKCIPWYPDQLAWQLQLTRKDIRRSEAYVRLHNFLISETECGSISRQEVVSMIPPLVLDVKPHHKVLDMCAAPGSKTAQLIELLHAGEGNIPDGFVIANDVDNKRCYMLVHQAKRLSSPCFAITNHDSSVMPNFLFTNKEGKKETLKFDRILCDVPCSGDGTIRKNPDVWEKWNAANGNNLHGIQYRIARRGAEMLAVGGRMVYSTCSFNPLEDEAVMHRLIVETNGAVELVDVSSELPGLVYSKGLSSWIPMSRDMIGYNTFEEVPEKWLTQIRPTMYPPSPENASKFNLDRCIRLLPHHQDTGGFFVAVLQKVSRLPWEASPETKAPTSQGTDPACADQQDGETGNTRSEPARKKRRIHGFREDPFIFFEDDEKVWPDIRDYYGLKDLDPKLLLTRCREGKKKNIYLANAAVRDIVMNNENKIKFINTGVKSFVRCENRAMTCPFRIAQEGLPSLSHYLSKRCLKMLQQDVITLCSYPMPYMSRFSHVLRREVEKLEETGCCILVYKDETHAGEPFSIELVGWKGKASVRAYVPKGERIHYLRLCGADVSKFELNKFKEKEQEDNKLESEDIKMEPEDDSIPVPEDSYPGEEDGDSEMLKVKKENGDNKSEVDSTHTEKELIDSKDLK